VSTQLIRMLFAALAAAAALCGQRLDPVRWSIEAPGAAAPGSVVLVRLTAEADAPWHLYSMTTPKPPIATTIRFEPSPAIASVKIHQPAPVRKLDPNFQTETETFEGKTVFLAELAIAPGAGGPVELTAGVRFQACTDKQCLPPRRKTLNASLSIGAGAPAAVIAIPDGYRLVPDSGPAAGSTPAPIPAAPAKQDLGSFLLLAFGFGLAAIFTPCVFPMIPITMSYFLNQGGDRGGRAVMQALVFCMGIVVLFTGIGLATTAAVGPFGVVQLGSNVWVNAFITVVFLVFAASMLGAFEITLPSGLLTRMNSASGQGGVMGSLLMGLTFSLTSFACVGPFMGTLLAASVQGDKLQPVLGMATFASGLALPFFLLALFPGALKKMPRSGGWMMRVKTVLGFVILAAALKYFSNVDQVMHWNVLTRDRFLAAWVVLFALPGLYLLGFLRMEGIKPEEPLKTGRLVAGMAFLAFALSLLPGMFGGRLGELDAYVPAAQEGAGLGSGGAGEGKLPWLKDQYQEALAKARAENKLVFVNFTGYTCTNCKWMKSNMFPRPEVSAALREFVLVELYTDGSEGVSEANQKLQETKFATVAIPFYAIVDADEKVVASFPSLTRDTAEFLAFLRSARKPA